MARVLPIRRVVRNLRVLGLLESQFSRSTELGLRLDEVFSVRLGVIECYSLYTRKDGEKFSSDRFVVERFRSKSGRIGRYCIHGHIYVD